MKTFISNRLRIAALGLGLAAAAANGATAGEITSNATFPWLATGTVYTVTGNHPYFVGAFSGIYLFEDEASPLHHAAIQCPGFNDIGVSAAGYCNATDAAGDQLFLTWSCEAAAPPAGGLAACDGTAKFVGGTGKFAAASGSAHMFGVTVAVNPDGTTAGYTDLTGFDLTY
ncbi:MAG: hypothetical protein H6873_13905 [Hyphomicrobiaceae bacterium]|nr:hypothetical protein [Hyphomicrobiaceae bacterium]